MTKSILFAIALSGLAAAAPAQTIQSDLVAARATICQPVTTSCTPAQLAAILNDVAIRAQLRGEDVGLLAKPNGNHCPQPRTGVLVSCDFLIKRDGSGADVIGASDAEATVHFEGFNYLDEQAGFRQRFVEPIDTVTTSPGPLPSPVPPVPQPAPGGSDVAAALSAINARLDNLSGVVTELTARQQGVSEQVLAVATVLADVQTAIATLAPPPNYVGKLLGFPVVLHPNR